MNKITIPRSSLYLFSFIYKLQIISAKITIIFYKSHQKIRSLKTASIRLNPLTNYRTSISCLLTLPPPPSLHSLHSSFWYLCCQPFLWSRMTSPSNPPTHSSTTISCLPRPSHPQSCSSCPPCHRLCCSRLPFLFL